MVQCFIMWFRQLTKNHVSLRIIIQNKYYIKSSMMDKARRVLNYKQVVLQVSSDGVRVIGK